MPVSYTHLQEGMERDGHGVGRVVCLESSGVGFSIDRVGPGLLWNRTAQHRRISGAIDRTEARSGAPETLFRIDVHREEVDRERVAGFRTLDVERSSQRIGTEDFHAGIFESVSIGIDGVGFENVPRLQVQHRRSCLLYTSRCV